MTQNVSFIDTEDPPYRQFVGQGFDFIASNPHSSIPANPHSHIHNDVNVNQLEQLSCHEPIVKNTVQKFLLARSRSESDLSQIFHDLASIDDEIRSTIDGSIDAYEQSDSYEYDEVDVYDDDAKKAIESQMDTKSEEFIAIQKAHAIKVYSTHFVVTVAFLCTLVVSLLSPRENANRVVIELDLVAHSLFHHISILGNQHVQSLIGISRSVTSTFVLKNEFAPSMSILSSFPYVTDPLYSVTTGNVDSGFGLLRSNVVYSPLVQSNLVEWSAYAAFENIRRFNNDSMAMLTVTNVIYSIDPTTKMKVPYVNIDNARLSPIWQLPAYGSAASDINFNIASIPTLGEVINFTTTNAATVFSLPLDPTNANEWAVSQQLQFLSYEMNRTNDDGPFSMLTVPVFDSVMSSSEKIDGDVVGTITAPFQWKSYLEGVFSERIVGVMVVIEFVNSTVGNSFVSYRIDGHKATYLGVGDLHHTFFDDNHRSANFIDILNNYSSSTGGPSKGIRNANTVPGSSIIVHVYPTSTFKKAVETNAPVTFTATVMIIWMVVVVIFLLFGNHFAQTIHTVVTKSATNQRIVNMLFPQEVQERMRQVHNEKSMKQDSSLQAIQSIIGEKSGVLLQNTIQESMKLPIADLFQSATVFFADIAGFTSWSADHDPVEVFTLLEALFKAIDDIATNLGVFKVETIGDCYLCVTGLPTPRDDHAKVMVLFACYVLRKIPKVMKGLSLELGDDCIDLSLRIGIHSGPVTAGVLRGEKARFQLFGDTVNTASRMESNGEKGQIQISDETAQELAKCGKENWYVPREGGIEAKGKGRLQTYWVRREKVIQTRTSISNFTDSTHCLDVTEYEQNDETITQEF